MEAWRHTDHPLLRYEAAYFAADILARHEKYSRSQFWLRRADQATPEVRGGRWRVPLRMCAKKNPLQVQLRFSLKPSKSVNNAAETAVIKIGGLPFRLDDSGVQLGGWEGAVGLSFGYRVSASETYRTDMLGEVLYAKVWLNSDAATLAPTQAGPTSTMVLWPLACGIGG